jgi:hypothetical protein
MERDRSERRGAEPHGMMIRAGGRGGGTIESATVIP